MDAGVGTGNILLQMKVVTITTIIIIILATIKLKKK